MALIESRELNVEPTLQAESPLERKEIAGIFVIDQRPAADFLERILAKAREVPKLPGEVNF